MLHIRVLLNDHYRPRDHISADLYIFKLVSALGKRSVQRRGEGRTRDVIHPVAALYALHGLFGRAELGAVFLFAVHTYPFNAPSSVSAM